MNMRPEEFLQSDSISPDDLIGKAGKVARLFCRRIASGNTHPIRLLCYGDPGIGKTAVCRIIANRLVGHSSFVSRISSSSLTEQIMKDWMHSLNYHHSEWRVFWVEEVDGISKQVEIMILKFLDDLPERTAALFTSNEKMSGISGRFQSRTQAIRFERPSAVEVGDFIIKNWPETKPFAYEIAETNNGDVRAALNDLQMRIDVDNYSKKESNRIPG